MEPEDIKPQTSKARGTEENVAGKPVEPREMQPEKGQPKAAGTAEPKPQAEVLRAEQPAEQAQAEPKIVPGTAVRRLSQRDFGRTSRRELLKVAPVIALGAFAIPGVQEWLLKKGLGFSDLVSGAIFRRNHLAPTFADSEVTPFEKFPINGYDVDDPGVILENWTLTVTGAVQKPGDYTLAQIQTLPLQRQNTRHVCVEGWDVIGRFGGTRLSNFLNMIGADTTAKFITVACADDYYESLDMATALHPQTLLCWEMYDRPLTRQHGAPVRLNIPTKIGYKQAKYLTDLKVTNVLDKAGYWEDQGYSDFYGL